MNLPDGWLSRPEAKYLVQLVRDVVGLEGSFLEVGSFQGRSAVIIGTEVKKLNDCLYCIDIWNKEMKGEDEIERQRIREEYRKMGTSVIDKYFKGDMYRIFTENIKKWKLDNIIIPTIGFSSMIRKTWKIPLRFIFIDGNHEYLYVRDDCQWRQFLICGGIIVFHDCRARTVREAINKEMDNDSSFETTGSVHNLKMFRRIK